MAKALTVAGSDTSSGAGVQADLKIFSNLHVYGTSVITALTAQNTRGIRKIAPVRGEMVKAQINAVLSDIKIDAIKIGMVYSKEIIEAVANSLKNVRAPIILDPVFRAGTGAGLLRADAYPIFVKRLIPIATFVTPNRMEAEKLAGMKIRDVQQAKLAAKKIADLGATSIIVKGGHMGGTYSTDVLYHQKQYFEFINARIKNEGLHGAGCTFSAALTAEIAKGMTVVDATRRANRFVRRAIENAVRIGKGSKIPSFQPIIPGNKILAELHKAVLMIEDTKDFGILIPESQSNFVYAKPKAWSIDDVAGVYGRIVRIGRGAKAAGIVGFGASRHVASAVLAMMKYDKSIRSAINLKYDERLIDISEHMQLKVSSYDRRNEPAELKSEEGMTVKWGIEQAVSKCIGTPRIVYHLGDWGKEPMILVFGENPNTVFVTTNSILWRYRTGLDVTHFKYPRT
jgi:hydroxymethylpyrimidine/phosphomethylpyrimidine kinase